MKPTDFDAHEQLAQGGRPIQDDDEDLVCYRGPVRAGELGSGRYYLGLASIALMAATLLLFFGVLALRPVLPDAAADLMVQAALVCLGLGMAGFLSMILVGPR